MSNKVCCNCRYCIRSRDTKYNIIVCRCEKHDRYLSYAEVMAGCCKTWKKEWGGDNECAD